VTVTNTAGPFKVTAPNTTVSWAAGSTQTITWDVANTTLAPVSTANVKILLSKDGGQTFPTVLVASTPNDGSEVVTIPAGGSTGGRVKIEAIDNIFFDISDANFNITGPLMLTTAASRKTHTGVGDFDINLPLTGPSGVECRSGAAGHKLVFTFSNPVASGNAAVSFGTATVSGTPTFSGDTMTVNLTGVTDIQTVGVTLSNVTDSFAQVLPNTVVNVSFLRGDGNASRTVNTTDIGQVKSISGAAIMSTNFRFDVNANGAINASDVGLVKASSGNILP
jgi:hypothetical protein